MFTLRNLLKASLVTSSLLLAGAARAGDATSDRAQAAANAKPGAVEDHRAPGGVQPAESKACHCPTAAPRSAPEPMPDDPWYQGG